MIAIAESGSTKCEWLFLSDNGNEIASIRTQGFNPYFHSSDFVKSVLNENSEFSNLKEHVKEVHFYGAGCSSIELNLIIESGLKSVFNNAEIGVYHDLLASAYSVYNGKPVIACILGTGSNSCYFNGTELKESLPALGFVLGDEAGGCYYGKKFLADFFYNALPAEIHEDFVSEYSLKWSDVVKNIYGNVHANVYLASFMPFIAKYKDHPYVEDMIREGMGKFLDIHVMGFEESENCEIGFVGSMSNVFQGILKEELKKRNLTLGKIIKSPIKELVSYHKNYLNSESKTNRISHS